MMHPLVRAASPAVRWLRALLAAPLLAVLVVVAEASDGVPILVYHRFGAVAADAMSNAVVVDLQDAGVRFYTYVTTVAYTMEEAAQRGIPVYPSPPES